jgi:DNA recombination-dependent growth factor C
MSIYNGSLAFTRYKVLGEPSKSSISALSKVITPFLAPPITIDGPVKPESMGWVRPLTKSDEEIVSEDSHWDMSDCQVNNAFLLRIRYERRKVPAALVQMLYKQKLREHLKSTGKNMKRTERQEFKEKLVQDLLKKTLPAVTYTDLLWNLDEHEVLIFSASKSVRQRAEQLFYQTFGKPFDISLIRFDGALAFLDDDDADEKDLSQRLSRMTKIEPAIFAPNRTA